MSGTVIEIEEPIDGAVLPAEQEFDISAVCQFPQGSIGTARGYWDMKDSRSGTFVPCGESTLIQAMSMNPFPVMQSDEEFSGVLNPTTTGNFDLRMRVVDDGTNEILFMSLPVRVKIVKSAQEPDGR